MSISLQLDGSAAVSGDGSEAPEIPLQRASDPGAAVADPLQPVIDPGAAAAAEQEQPFAVAEAFRLERGRAEQGAVLEKLDAALLDPDGFARGNGTKGGADQVKRLLAGSYMRYLNGGLEFPNSTARDVFRDRFAQANFDGRGMGNDGEFFGEAQKQALGRKAHKELVGELTSAASVAATVDYTAGPTEAESWPQWIEKARKKPGYDPAKEADYLEGWKSTQAALKEQLAPFGPTLQTAWASLKRGDLNLAKFYGDLEPEQRKPFLASLKLMAQTLPEKEQATFWGNMAKSAKRSASQFLDDVIGGFSTSGVGDQAGRESYEREAAGFGAGPSRDEQKIAMRNFEADINAVRDSSFDPIKVLNPNNSFLNWGEQAMYGLPQTASFMAVAAVPGIGDAAVLAASESFIYRQMRDSMLQGGATDEVASRFAYEAAPWVSVPYAGLEKLQMEAAIGKLPFFEKFLQGTANKITNGALRFAGRMGMTATLETGVENLQDFLPAITQEAASALSKDVPGVQWHNGKDGFFDGYWEKTAVTWGTMLPLSVFAGLGGVENDARTKAFSAASDTQLRALGITREGVQNIREAQVKGMGSAAHAIDTELTRRNPFSEEAKAAVGELEAAAKLQQSTAQQVAGSDVFPRMVRTDAGWTLYDQESGEEIGKAVDQAGALRLASAHMDLQEEQHADEIAYLSTLMEAGEATRKGDKEGEKTVVDLRPGEAMSAERMMERSQADEARILAQVQARAAVGETVDLTAAVLGENVTETRRGIREMTNRIYGGGSVLTVLHEDGHKRLRLAQAKGHLLRPELIALGRALDTVLKGKLTKDGRPLQLLPENEAEITDAMLDEMVSELLESEVLRRRKTGGTYGLPAAVLSKNLGALTRLQSGAVKSIKAFVDAFRAMFGLATSRAYEIRKGIKAGTIQEAELDRFMARLSGTSEQDEFDAEAQRHAEEILGGDVFEGDPFSLAPSTPERDARPLEALQIPEGVLEGQRADLRRQIRQMITEELQGKTVVNKDSGREIRFNADSKREAVAKLRREPAFRTALQVRPIVENAVLVGEVAAEKAREQDSERFEYFAVPVEVDGKREVAWFNVRIVKRGGDALFYEFGLYEEKRAPATQGLGDRESDPNTPQPGLQGTVGGFLREIKGSLPAAIKVEGGAFSLAGSQVAAQLREDAFSRIQDPIRRAQAMSRIARSMEEAKLAFERAELLTKNGRRIANSLRREASMREALRREELENEAWARHMAVLSDDELTKLKSQPGHAFLSDPKSPLKGRLRSKSAALKKNPEAFKNGAGASYDGSEVVSRTVFGGDLQPDLAAQEMFEAGLLRAPSTDLMWQLLESEGRHVAQMKQFLETAKEDLREAKQQAKREANEWLAAETKDQKDPEKAWSPKQEILRTLELMDGIMRALPAEIRGKLGGYTQLARIGTNENRLNFLRDRLEKADEMLERWLKAQYQKEFFELLDKARPEKDEAGQKPKGKIGADVHALFASLRAAMQLSAAEGEAEAVKLETLVAGGELTAEQESHATLEANLIRLVADWFPTGVEVKDPETGEVRTKLVGGASAARREAALLEATRVYLSGYLAHRAEVMRRREARQQVREALQRDTGRGGTAAARQRRREADEMTKIGRTKAGKFTLLSFEQLLHEAFGLKSKEAQRLADWERQASYARTDALQNKLDLVDHLLEQLAGSNLKAQQLRAKLGAPGTIEIGGLRLSELEGITASLMWRQEDGRRHMEGHLDDAGKPRGEWHYGQDFVDQVEAKLSPEAKALRVHLSEQYAAEYDRLNSIYRQLYGVSLPRHKLYSPLTVVPQQVSAGQVVDPVSGFGMADSGFTPGSLKNRSITAIAEPSFKDALQVYLAHARQMEHWMAYAPFVADAQAILNDRGLRNSVEEGTGQQGRITLAKWLDYFARGGVQDAQAQMAIGDQIGRVMARNASMALVGRMSVLAIQSTQLGAALAEVPTGAYVARFAKLMTGKLGWGAALDSAFIKRRLVEMPPVVKQAMEGLRSGKPTRVKQAVRWMGSMISGADALFTAGTYAIIYDYQISQAKAMGLQGQAATEYARQAAERGTERVAQPVRPGTRSLYENSLTSPYGRMIWMFASEARQKVALSVLGHKDRTAGEKLRAYAVTWLIGGVVSTMIRAAVRDMRDDGDDDEVFDKRNWNPAALGLSALTGPLGGVPVFGDMIEAGAFKLAGERLPSGGLPETVVQGITSAKHVPQWFSGEREIHDAVKDAESMATAGGLLFEGSAAWTSILHVLRDLVGISGNVAE